MKKHVVGLATMPLIVAGVTGAVASPVFADEGYVAAGCSDLQHAISSTPDVDTSKPFQRQEKTYVQLTENCAADIVVPKNKSIVLSVVGKTLTNASGNTITVEKGGSLFLYSLGSPGGPSETFVNTTNGKAVIENHGFTVVSAYLTAENGAYSIINDGELNAPELSATGLKINNSGTLRIGHADVDNADQARPYITGSLNGEGYGGDPRIDIPDTVPVGYKTTLQYNRPALAATDGFEISTAAQNSDGSDILSITGSALDGFQFEAKKSGTVSITQTDWLAAGQGQLETVYDIYSNTKGLLTQSMYEHLVEHYGYNQHDSGNALTQALDEGKDIYVNLYVDDIDADSVDAEEKTVIADAADGATVVGYADITLAVETNEGDLIDQISYILPRAGNAAGDILYEGSVNVRWSGLKLAQPAKGYQRNYYAIGVHNGKATKVAAYVDENGDVIFPAGAFSTYAIVYVDVEVPVTEDTANTPETGVATYSDNGKAIASLIGCMVAGVAVAFTMMPKIKKHLKNKKA